jgi:hypothetical protein
MPGRVRATTTGGGIWLIQGEVDGDMVSDFELFVTLSAPHTLAASDFIL